MSSRTIRCLCWRCAGDIGALSPMQDSIAKVKAEDEAFLAEVLARVSVARAKHPTCGLIGVTGEYAEVVHEVMKNGSAVRLRDECIDLAVTALRLAIEGDT